MQQRKLLFFIGYLLLFAILSFRTKVTFFPGVDPMVVFLQTIIFGAIFSYFMWEDTLSRIYHIYMRFSRVKALKNLALALFGEVTLSAVFLAGFGGLRNLDFGILLVDPVMFGGAFLLMYYWVDALSLGGFFSGTILVIAKPTDRQRPMTWIQDPYRNKKIVYLDSRLATADSLSKAVVQEKVSEVVLLAPDLSPDLLDSLAAFLNEKSIGYFIVTNLGFWQTKGRYNIEHLIRGYTNRDSLLNMTLKRLLDLILSSFALFALIPVYLVVALLIKLDDGGPIFYVSKRVGKGGKLINFYKFRSMVVDADAKKASLAALNERANGPLFKMRNDPRVTRIGRVIRKYSLDELPQIINVLRGTLSLVGPRPHLVSEAAHYQGFDFQRLDCVPGITCIAQITDRNGLSFEKWIELDIKYRNEWSFLLDFIILAKTVKVVFHPVTEGLRGRRVHAY